jgi:hypothetical protein
MSKTKTFALFLTFVVAVALGSSTALAQAPAATAPAAAAPAAAAPALAAALKPAALGLAVYPGKGQDATQQSKDEGECYTWARQQTGIDPTVAATPAPVAEAPKGGAVKGAARGAAKGAAVGAVGDDDRVRDEGHLDAGEGAAAGAAAGAAKGRRHRRRARSRPRARRSRPHRRRTPRTRTRSRSPGVPVSTVAATA